MAHRLTAEEIAMISHLMSLDEDKYTQLINRSALKNYEGLTEELINLSIKDSPDVRLLRKNNVTEEQYIEFVRNFSDYSKPTEEDADFILRLGAKYKSDRAYKVLLYHDRLCLKTIPNASLFDRTPLEVIKDLDDRFKKKLMMRKGGYTKDQHIETPFNDLISKERLSDDVLDFFVGNDLYERTLYHHQFLTEEQIEKMGISKYEAWNRVVLSDAETYRPNWTNKGDPEMIGPNMPDEYGQACVTSKKESVVRRMAKWGPEKYLLKLMGRDKQADDTIAARLSNDPDRIWNATFKRW